MKAGTEPARIPFLWKALVDLGVSATTIGTAELEHWTRIDSLRKAFPLPIVASNLFHLDDDPTPGAGKAGRPVSERTLVLERGGLRIGLVGLLDPAELSRLPAEERRSWMATAPDSCLRELLPPLRQQTDLVVLLSQLGAAQTDSLLERTDGIDVALYGFRAPHEEDADRIGDTIVLRSGSKGQYLGRLDLRLGGPHEIREVHADTRALDRRFEEDPDWAERVARGVAEAEAALQTHRRREQEAFEALFR